VSLCQSRDRYLVCVLRWGRIAGDGGGGGTGVEIGLVNDDHGDVQHAVDNKGTVDIHGLRTDKSLFTQHYHSSIRRLHAAMTERATPLTAVHTLSHLEHSETADNDCLFIRIL
jgi:hypothetical protein